MKEWRDKRSHGSADQSRRFFPCWQLHFTTNTQANSTLDDLQAFFNISWLRYNRWILFLRVQGKSSEVRHSYMFHIVGTCKNALPKFSGALKKVNKTVACSFTRLFSRQMVGLHPRQQPSASAWLVRPATRRINPTVVMNFLRCRLSFSLLRSSPLCLRGSRSNRSLNTTCLSQDSLSLVASEGRLNWMITCSWHVPSLFVCLSECISPLFLSVWLFCQYSKNNTPTQLSDHMHYFCLKICFFM